MSDTGSLEFVLGPWGQIQHWKRRLRSVAAESTLVQWAFAILALQHKWVVLRTVDCAGGASLKLLLKIGTSIRRLLEQSLEVCGGRQFCIPHAMLEDVLFDKIN